MTNLHTVNICGYCDETLCYPKPKQYSDTTKQHHNHLYSLTLNYDVTLFCFIPSKHWGAHVTKNKASYLCTSCLQAAKCFSPFQFASLDQHILKHSGNANLLVSYFVKVNNCFLFQ